METAHVSQQPSPGRSPIVVCFTQRCERGTHPIQRRRQESATRHQLQVVYRCDVLGCTGIGNRRCSRCLRRLCTQHIGHIADFDGVRESISAADDGNAGRDASAQICVSCAAAGTAANAQEHAVRSAQRACFSTLPGGCILVHLDVVRAVRATAAREFGCVAGHAAAQRLRNLPSSRIRGAEHMPRWRQNSPMVAPMPVSASVQDQQAEPALEDVISSGLTQASRYRRSTGAASVTNRKNARKSAPSDATVETEVDAPHAEYVAMLSPAAVAVLARSGIHIADGVCDAPEEYRYVVLFPAGTAVLAVCPWVRLIRLPSGDHLIADRGNTLLASLTTQSEWLAARGPQDPLVRSEGKPNFL